MGFDLSMKILLGLMVMLSPALFGAEIHKQTFTYKRVGPLDIKADVYRTDDMQLQRVAVWIHGGALIMGNREGIDRTLKASLLEAGYTLVSIDYRLAPETKLPDIIADVEDAIKWVRTDGPRLFQIEPTKIAVLGGSAGGYLTLATGHRVDPPPTVLVALFGYGDLIGDWYSKPSTHARHQNPKMTEEEARKQVDGPPIADSRDRKGNGSAFYQFCRQTGRWPLEVSGWDPFKEPGKFVPYMPVMNVTKTYPSTLLIHGTADTDVPYEQSTMMAEQLKKNGVRHELITIVGGEHGFGGGDPEEIKKAYARAIEFVNERMQ